MSTDVSLASKTWHVRIDIGEHDERTHVIARLNTGAGTDVRGGCEAHVNARDSDAPEITDELQKIPVDSCPAGNPPRRGARRPLPLGDMPRFHLD